MSAQIIKRCIDHRAAKRDNRGRLRAEKAGAQALHIPGGSDAAARAAAAAATRIGIWLSGVRV